MDGEPFFLNIESKKLSMVRPRVGAGRPGAMYDVTYMGLGIGLNQKVPPGRRYLGEYLVENFQ